MLETIFNLIIFSHEKAKYLFFPKFLIKRIKNHPNLSHLALKEQLTFSEIESVLLNCLFRPRFSVLHFPQVISRFDNALDLIEMNLRKDNCLYSLHPYGILSLDLDFKMQFGNRLL